MEEIKSRDNQKLKNWAKLKQKKYREETGRFIAEGLKALEDLINSNIKILEVFSLKEIKNEKINAPVYIINESDMKKICDADSPCSILAAAEKKKEDINSFKKLNNIVLLDSASDPGNLGTIIRSAAAFGIEGIILYGNCADIYSPKVIRSAAGNLFKIPFIHINSIEELNKHFKNHIKISSALSKENNISISECARIKQKIIMLGSEAKGLSKDLLKTADKNILLKMKNGVESLNLAVCASIIFYELDKSR